MDIQEYMQTRVDAEIQWYNKRSNYCQRMYKGFQIAEIVLAALIPLLSAYSEKSYMVAFTIGSFGAVIATIESIGKLFKYHEYWVQYRTTCELLKHQKYLFLTQSPPYSPHDRTAENIFVKNIETIISSENNQWKMTSAVNKNDSDQDGPYSSGS